MSGLRKMKSLKIAIIALSVLLVVISAFTVYFINSDRRNKSEIERMSGELSRNEKYSSMLDAEVSDKNSIINIKDSEAQSYESRLYEESAYQSKVDELNSKVSELNKQLAAKNESTTGTQVVKPPVSVPSGDKTVYLTFDDGPSSNTPAILDILDRYGVKATFFVINSGANNKYMKDIVDRGHQIALHSYSHDYSKIYASDADYFDDLQKISDLVKEQTGVETNIIRFPGGKKNTVSKSYSKGIMTRLASSVTEKGYVYFDWNCANNDATGKPTTVESQVQACGQYPKSAQNIVVLMHDVTNKKVTVQALPKIIEYYQSLRYEVRRAVILGASDSSRH